MLGGFSQGGVMSYALGLGAGRPRPAGIMALSSFIPTVDGFELGDATGLPVAIGHGTYDPVIGVEFGREARDRLDRGRGRGDLPRVADAARDRPGLPARAAGLGQRLPPERAPDPVEQRAEEEREAGYRLRARGWRGGR